MGIISANLTPHYTSHMYLFDILHILDQDPIFRYVYYYFRYMCLS